MKMTTFVEVYDEESEEEVVIVPFVKPTPPLITLAESEDESTCSENSPSSSPKPKKRKVHSCIVVGRTSGNLSELYSTRQSDATSASNGPEPTSAECSQRKVKDKASPNDENEDGGAPQSTIEKSWTKPSTLPSGSKSTRRQRQRETNNSASSTPSKSFTNETREEFIRFAASLGVPVLSPESQEELLRKGAKNNFTDAGPVDWEDINKEEDDDDDDCIVLDDDDDDEGGEKLVNIKPTSTSEPPPSSPKEGFVNPTAKIQSDAEAAAAELELEVIESPTPTRDMCIFPPTWTPEMQHFYGDKRPNFSTTKIYRKQSDETRLWRIFEGGQRHRRKNMYIQCNNCQQRGHRARDCPEEIKGLICWMCGEHGDHHVERCPKRMCLNCGRHTNRFQFPCHKCGPPNERLRNSILLGKCALCDMEGHLDGRCPDHWRRFHSTTLTQTQSSDGNDDDSGGSKKTPTNSWKIENNGKSEYLRKSKSSCANCGMKGHNYYQCKGSRQQSACFINTPLIIHELSADELKEVEKMCNNNNKANPKYGYDFEEDATSPHTDKEEGGHGQGTLPLPPNFNSRNERIVSLDATDHELLRDAYEQKVPAALLFFSSHIHNIIKIVPREKTIDIHLNGASSTKVRNAKRNLFRTLAKLRIEKGLVEMEHASTDDLSLETANADFLFSVDPIGNRNWPAADDSASNKYMETLKEKSQGLYLKTVVGQMNQMVPNPLYSKDKDKSTNVIKSDPTETEDPALEPDNVKETHSHNESADADNAAWRVGSRSSSAAERIKFRKEREQERFRRQHDPHHSREVYQHRRNRNQKRERGHGSDRDRKQQQQPPPPARAPRYFD